jgi:pilus assembly protein CpaE
MEGEAWQLVTYSTASELWSGLQQQHIDLMLVDIQWPPARTLLAQLAKRWPALPILVLATAQQFDDLSQALLDGATSFILQPIESQRFKAAVRCATHTETPQESPKRGRVVAVTGLTGGAGRSTIAANLAIALHQRHAADVLLIEGHQHLSCLASMLNLYPICSLADLAQPSTLALHIIEGYLQRHSSGIRTLTAPSAFALWMEIPLETWRTILSCAASLSDFVVIDTAAVADELLAEILAQADEVLIVTTPTATSWRTALDLQETLQTAEEIQARIHILLNKADMQHGLRASFLKKQVQETSLVSVCEDAVLATYALNRGVPFVLSHPHSLLSRQIYRLADAVCGVAGARSPGAAPSLLTALQQAVGALMPRALLARSAH